MERQFELYCDNVGEPVIIVYDVKEYETTSCLGKDLCSHIGDKCGKCTHLMLQKRKEEINKHFLDNQL